MGPEPNGGREETAHPGMQIYYHNITLVVVVSTGTSVWVIRDVGHIVDDWWVQIAVSWSADENLGLQLYVNGDLVARTQKPFSLLYTGIEFAKSLEDYLVQPPEHLLLGCCRVHPPANETAEVDEYEHFTDGVYDELAFWPWPLRQSELSLLLPGLIVLPTTLQPMMPTTTALPTVPACPYPEYTEYVTPAGVATGRCFSWRSYWMSFDDAMVECAAWPTQGTARMAVVDSSALNAWLLDNLNITTLPEIRDAWICARFLTAHDPVYHRCDDGGALLQKFIKTDVLAIRIQDNTCMSLDLDLAATSQSWQQDPCAYTKYFVCEILLPDALIAPEGNR
ncbi:PREDICTED: uncharacterized protein LOC106817868 [Priapulus caudatus]|uniref:Uncharacterized protein LOC106817868 n=1 Tax=Priapulus caudatus TaxID=37621 RepID=A0ABM1F0U5_PRICU|nr:PREDICTED: uncharacterized protein LOC106817868 [Priapulus caudatus]